MTFAHVVAPKRALFSDLKSSKLTKAGRGGSKKSRFMKLLGRWGRNTPSVDFLHRGHQSWTLVQLLILAAVNAPTWAWWLWTWLPHWNWSPRCLTVALHGLTLGRMERCQSVTKPHLLCRVQLYPWLSISFGRPLLELFSTISYVTAKEDDVSAGVGSWREDSSWSLLYWLST